LLRLQWLTQAREQTLQGQVDRMATVEQRARRLNTKLKSRHGAQ
jgi:hypothetical protein